MKWPNDLSAPGHDVALLALARRWMGNPADAEDVLQDAWLRALERAPQSLQVPRAWLTTVLHHIAIDRLRRRGVETAAFAAWAGATDAEAARALSAEQTATNRRHCREALMHLAVRLSAAEAAVLLLHEFFEHDHAQIAPHLGKTPVACRQMLSRALRRLKAAPGAHREASDFETVYALCCQAIETHQPQPLYALMQPPATASSFVSCDGVSAPTSPVDLQTAPAVSSALALVGGRWLMRVEQGGVLLCLLPLGACGNEDCLTGPVASQLA